MYVTITGQLGGTTYNLVADPQTWANVSTENVYLVCDTTLGAVTINLPEISDLGNALNVKVHVSDSAGTAGMNNIIIVSGGSDTINDAASVTLNSNGASSLIEVQSQTQWLADVSYAETPLYKSYVALLNQSGVTAPVATVLQNELGGTPVWTYNAAGNYTLTLANAFDAAKTVILGLAPIDGVAVVNSQKIVGYVDSSPNTIIVETFNETVAGAAIVKTGADAILFNIPIEIRVYP